MIVGVESSCDESALALFEPTAGLKGEWVHSQIVKHRAYGGVVPDIASREHMGNFPALVERLCSSLGDRPVTTVAVTYGPGLAGCLALGVALGKSLALAWGVELAGVNHLRGHAYSPWIPLHGEDPSGFEGNLEDLLPHLGLIVSGGNTVLFHIGRDRAISVLATTVDDAAGEALDKGAKLLGLGYPGGPLIEKFAAGGDSSAFDFPRAFMRSGEAKFSFSGLKTSLRYRLEKMSDDELRTCMGDICASYEEAVVDALMAKTRQVLGHTKGCASIGLSGGVANNAALRERFLELADDKHLPAFIALPEHTGDNAAMIAFAAYADPAGLLPADGWSLPFYPALGLG
jgi:N6-L-threonylcarbamoyladenine synthase